jgi:glycosyltransferase involved in cell wall biosynthesis
MKILITTGIYPPKIGGPSQYAKNLKEAFEKMGHIVSIKTYGLEDKLPSGIRHLFFFFKIIPSVLNADAVFTLDTFSVGLPSVLACKIFGKKGIIRTGGDFLWEQYVERTGKKILLRNFYNTEKPNFSFKERKVFKLTKWTLKNASKIIFSTDWQRKIFIDAYNLKPNKISVLENYYGNKESDLDYQSKFIISSSRDLVIKNSGTLHEIFSEIKEKQNGISLFDKNLPYNDFMEMIKGCFCVVNVSLSEISPNIILDAIRFDRPFICTKEVGIYDRIKDAGIFVNPLNEKEIKDAILYLLTEEGYKKEKEKVKRFNFVHTWNQIAEEFIGVYKSL